MKIKELIKQLKELEKDGKIYLTLKANSLNGEDEDYDLYMNHLELWNDGEETATLFMSNITEYDINNNPIINQR